MAVSKKRTASIFEKRKTKVLPRPPRGSTQRDVPRVGNPLDILAEANDISELTFMADGVGDPDESVLSQPEDELLDEEVLDLKNPEVAAELSEDPVRLYLREIGQVKLLDSDSEFRLATMIEANRLISTLRRRHFAKIFRWRVRFIMR